MASDPSRSTPPAIDKSDTTNRMVFILQRVVPFAGLVLLALVIAGAIFLGWVRVLLLVIAGLLALLAAAGAVYHAIASRRDRVELPPQGVLADAGGLKLHMLVMGEARDKPTVILEGGMASFAANWHWVQTELAKDTRVVAYDRAGFGWSEASPRPRDVRNISIELHTALQGMGIAGPYILAGCSFGGQVVRTFTDLFPAEVPGLVLVDGSHPDQCQTAQ